MPAPQSPIERLQSEPERFEFHQAVRLLERWFARQPRGESASGGMAARIRYRNSLSLAFPASEIAALEVMRRPPAEDADGIAEEASKPARKAGAPVREPAEVAHVEITPTFMGLLGAHGTLPTFYSELLAEREAFQRDPSARAFLDIFQQRALTLFHEAWRKHRLPLRFEADRRDQFLPLVLSVAGLGQQALRDRLRAREGGLSDDAVAYYAGAIQHRPLSTAQLGAVLSDYFAVPVAVTPFVGRWFLLPLENQTLLGRPPGSHGMLGAGAVVGERVWQRDLRVRLRIGPMTHERLRRFLPGGTAALALQELLKLLAGVSLEYEVRLALKAGEVRSARLDPQEGARLGWDSFLLSARSAVDRDEAGYDLLAVG